MSTEYDRTGHPERATAADSPNAHESRWATAESEAHADEREAAAAEYGTETERTSTASSTADSPQRADEFGETDSGGHVSAADQHAEALTETDVDPHAAAASAADPEREPATEARLDAPAADPGTAADAEVGYTGSAANTPEDQRTSLDSVGAALFGEADLDRLRTQWREVQGAFVDSPRDAVTQADKIVSDVIYQLTTAYAERKRVLEEHRSGLQDADTEELRQALRGYRGFFRRLLTIES
ncbi:hypothetical protein [Nocardia brasiliensis]|uniref:hypothetical protein n=1 Tax=Nocardia brasiliensis TaxID=37326 RepID=UPI0018949BA6|nr:hypothetical protein [Nocardia brasiliensis]MBF6543286.1 hypothetical protein [Nocardia brasiliensis]